MAMQENGKVIDIFQQSELFKDLSNDIATRLYAKCNVIKLPKNKMLYVQDDDAENCYYVHQGHVKLFRNTADGEESVIDIVTTGSLIGETSFF